MDLNLDELRNQWKTNDALHPTVDFNEEALMEAILKKKKLYDYAWVAPALTILFFAILLATLPGNVFYQPALLGSLLFTMLFSGFILFKILQARGHQKPLDHLKNSSRKAKLLAIFSAMFSALLAFLLMMAMIRTELGIVPFIQEQMLIILFTIVFAQQWWNHTKQYRELDSAVAEFDQDHEEAEKQLLASVANQAQREARNMKWALWVGGIALIIGSALYLTVYPNDTLLGALAGILFSLIIVLYKWFQSKDSGE